MIKNKRNPILPLNLHIPDVEAHVMPDGKLYLYGSLDVSDEYYCSETYCVISTKDMNVWEISEKSFDIKQVFWLNNTSAKKYKGIDWDNPTPFIKKMLETRSSDHDEKNVVKSPIVLFAPDAIHKDGKYYLYFCMSDDSEGVAIGDNPNGPFYDPIQLPCGGIDPAVFIDDDEQAYYYWGQLYAHGVKLNENMTSFNSKNIVNNLLTEHEHYFHEGSSMRKIGNNYYMVYSNIEKGKPTSLGYSIGKSPLGPFTYMGIIINNETCDPASWNNHGSIECFNGQWYLFYHRSSRGVKQYRRLCIEKININKDGSIDEVEMTSQGIGNPFSNDELIMGYQACSLIGDVFINLDHNGEEVLCNFKKDDEVIFRYIESEVGFNNCIIDSTGFGEIELFLNDIKVGKFSKNKNDVFEIKFQEKIGHFEVKLKIHSTKNLVIKSIKFN